MDYQLKPISRTCAATGKALEPGDHCRSALVEREGKVIRLDFADDAWSEPPAGIIGHWRSIVPQPESNKPRPLDIDAMMAWFEQMSESPGNPVQERFRYVVALLLVRKRWLRIDGSREDGDIEFLQLSGLHGEGNFEVREQELDRDQIVQLQNQLTAQLAGDG